MKSILNLSQEEWMDEIKILGFPAFNGKQIFEWIHQKQVFSFQNMTNLSAKLRNTLEELFEKPAMKVVHSQVSQKDETQKTLFELKDGSLIESVLMKYHYGYSICISTQVGCRMGCKFCASGLDGLYRNLEVGEILEQIYLSQQMVGSPIKHLVLMGTGEPLDNLENVKKALEILTHPKGMNMSWRNITISTCGLAKQILELADYNKPFTLAISLHAATDEKRKEIMPIAYRYSLNELLSACKVYFEKTGRRISFEYALNQGITDLDEDVEALSKLLKGFPCHVNLIPLNPIKERNYQSTTRQNALKFKNKLEKRQINVTIRREMGRDIDGACGQLRRRFSQENER